MKKIAVFLVICLFLLASVNFVYSQRLGDNQYNDSYKKMMMDKFRERMKMNNGMFNISGKNITIKELSDEQKEIIADKINAKTGLNLTADDIDNKTVLRAFLSNGRFAIVKTMPDTASQIALQRLKAKCEERNCSIELKEVGVGNKTRLAYEIKTEKSSKVFLLFKKNMAVRAQVDAETGEIIAVKRPWWAFIAKDNDE